MYRNVKHWYLLYEEQCFSEIKKSTGVFRAAERASTCLDCVCVWGGGGKPVRRIRVFWISSARFSVNWLSLFCLSPLFLLSCLGWEDVGRKEEGGREQRWSRGQPGWHGDDLHLLLVATGNQPLWLCAEFQPQKGQFSLPFSAPCWVSTLAVSVGAFQSERCCTCYD